ncbi:MAG: glycosyltransferase family 2 protein, partial [Pseudomonadota bacterium]
MAMTEQARVAAVVPHYGRDTQSNEWLKVCVRSLLEQTTPLDAIVVMDDASPCSPETALAPFQEVTLLRSRENVGPFALVDHCFSRLDMDAILLSDSDDHSRPERLERLLAAARRTDAEMIGCLMEIELETPGLSASEPPERPEFPRDFLLQMPESHLMTLPSCLIATQLVKRLGGLATGLRFGGDSEFVRRAIIGGEVYNLQETLYVRRIHPDSLTRNRQTGFGTEARVKVQQALQARARSLVRTWCLGEATDLSPLTRREQPLRLKHL